MEKKSIIVIFMIIILLSFTLFSGCITDKQSIEYDGLTRTYLIHIPDFDNVLEEKPLLIALHGGGGNSENMRGKTGFNDLADEHGFIVVYPDGTGKLKNKLVWNAGYCCGSALENNVDDVGFIDALIKELQKTLNIDENGIYVTGHSNGGMMAYRLGSELSDIIAAIAPVAGTIGGQATEEENIWQIPVPNNPVSVIAFHGLLDQSVPYYGGHGNRTSGTRIDFSVNQSISFWVEQNNCNPVPDIDEQGNISVKTYLGGDRGTEVVLYTIINGDHYWPGSQKDPYMDVSASEIIWDFFKTHPKQ
ncbi:MAG: polyhydroxybutyrate depolymerase [Thermoplasmata archaeon]|nr:MAG: polyhydroxybutyrate depolymerase [Thermoplasmata archaeon]